MDFDEGTILDHVQERPNPELDWNSPYCPMCHSTDLDSDGEISTLLGWIFPGMTDIDDRADHPLNPNNTLCPYTCNNCGFDFNYSVKSGNIYVTHDTEGCRKILDGVPNNITVLCIYTCAQCSGKITVEQVYKPRGELFRSSKDPSHGFKLTCSDCDLNVTLHPDAGYEPEVDRDKYWNGGGIDKFYIKEQSAGVVVNSKAIKKDRKT